MHDAKVKLYAGWVGRVDVPSNAYTIPDSQGHLSSNERRMAIIKLVGSIVQLAGVLKDASDDFRKVAAGKSKNEKWAYYRVSSLVTSLVSTCRSISEQFDSLHAIGGYFPC